MYGIEPSASKRSLRQRQGEKFPRTAGRWPSRRWFRSLAQGHQSKGFEVAKVVSIGGQEGGKEHRGFGCCAHGCPLPGVTSDATDGSGEYRCWAHDRAEEAGQWPYLTQGIRGNLWLFRLVERVGNMPLYDLERAATSIDDYILSKGRPDLRRAQNDGSWPEQLPLEPRPEWVQRMLNAAFSEAMGYVYEHWSPKRVAPKRTPVIDVVTV